MPRRLKLDYLEQIPKEVFKVSSWRDPANLMADANVAAKVAHIIRCIENGSPLQTGFYRKGAGLNADELLQMHGIMHLHLGKSNTEELLYLVQYPDHVVLLELSGHGHFIKPVGMRLKALHDKPVADLQRKLVAAPSQPPKPLIKIRKHKKSPN